MNSNVLRTEKNTCRSYLTDSMNSNVLRTERNICRNWSKSAIIYENVHSLHWAK